MKGRELREALGVEPRPIVFLLVRFVHQFDREGKHPEEHLVSFNRYAGGKARAFVDVHWSVGKPYVLNLLTGEMRTGTGKHAACVGWHAHAPDLERVKRELVNREAVSDAGAG